MSMLVALHRGEGWIARAIRWQTRSVYSHASIVLEESECVVEAREFEGVRMVQWKDVEASGERVDLFRVKGLTEEAEEVVREFLWEQMGKPYDYTMVARFVSRRQEKRASSGKWFCSELVFAALAKAGVRLLERIEAWEVSPGVLAHSPRLVEVRGEKWEGRQSGNIEHPTLNSEHREGENLATDGTRITRMEGISDLRFEISKAEGVGRGNKAGIADGQSPIGKGAWGVEASGRLGGKTESSLRTPKGEFGQSLLTSAATDRGSRRDACGTARETRALRGKEGFCDC